MFLIGLFTFFVFFSLKIFVVVIYCGRVFSSARIHFDKYCRKTNKRKSGAKEAEKSKNTFNEWNLRRNELKLRYSKTKRKRKMGKLKSNQPKTCCAFKMSGKLKALLSICCFYLSFFFFSSSSNLDHQTFIRYFSAYCLALAITLVFLFTAKIKVIYIQKICVHKIYIFDVNFLHFKLLAFSSHTHTKYMYCCIE